MAKLHPNVSERESVCAEITPSSCSMIVFGASGDLTQRKLIASLFGLYERELLPEKFYVLGCGRKQYDDESFRNKCFDAIKNTHSDADEKQVNEFTKKLYYLSGDYSDKEFYHQISSRLEKLNVANDVCGCSIYYLAVPPELFCTIAEHLGKSGLAYTGISNADKCARLVIEKPFGRDLETSLKLNEKITAYFSESQIYRIDHYLGKETVQNILMFRFANSIFEPLWNRNYIEDVQITITESLGIGHRAGYYDKSGALRDMFQNHMIQLLSLVAMEPPGTFEADSIRDEKVKVIKSLRPISANEIDKYFVRGQYTEGEVAGEKVCGYLEENGVLPESKTETYVAANLYIDNWRWKGVPFYLRSGKCLKNKLSEIAIKFRDVPHSLFAGYGIETLPANILVMRIQPREGIELSFQAKRPGSKVCMSTLSMDFDYQEIFGMKVPQAYQRLLLDCMVGDQTLFSRHDSVELSWRFFTPILKNWETRNEKPFKYPAGSSSFSQADELLSRDNKKWRDI